MALDFAVTIDASAFRSVLDRVGRDLVSALRAGDEYVVVPDGVRVEHVTRPLDTGNVRPSRRVEHETADVFVNGELVERGAPVSLDWRADSMEATREAIAADLAAAQAEIAALEDRLLVSGVTRQFTGTLTFGPGDRLDMAVDTAPAPIAPLASTRRLYRLED